MNITVKRFEMGGVESAIGSAKADLSYTGSATFGGVDSEGNSVVVTITFADETPVSK